MSSPPALRPSSTVVESPRKKHYSLISMLVTPAEAGVQLVYLIVLWISEEGTGFRLTPE
jgi:hypothetical protein